MPARKTRKKTTAKKTTARKTRGKRAAAKKTAGAKKAASTRSAAVARRRAKFAGVVRMTPPHADPKLLREKAIRSGRRVVVSIEELWVGKLPEYFVRSEVTLQAILGTSDAKGRAVRTAWSSGLFYYVEEGTRLNVQDVVVLDEVINQHLSLDLELSEVEAPQMNPNDAADLTSAIAEVALVSSGASGGAAAALDVFPLIVSSVLRLNGDDQVLKLLTSLYTRDVPDAGKHYLAEGAYAFEKLPHDSDEPQVRLVLRVRAVGPG